MMTGIKDGQRSGLRERRCIAFEGSRRIAAGELKSVVLAVKKAIDENSAAEILIFDDVTSEFIEVDFRGTVAEILDRLTLSQVPGRAAETSSSPNDETPRGPGRPKLGVVGKEVTLLPRHWEWLNTQPGGASVALRKLVEEARRANQGKDRVRQSREATYKFMLAMAGDAPGFEEAARALFAGNLKRFDEFVEPWPADVRDHAKKLASTGFEARIGSTKGKRD